MKKMKMVKMNNPTAKMIMDVKKKKMMKKMIYRI